MNLLTVDATKIAHTRVFQSAGMKSKGWGVGGDQNVTRCNSVRFLMRGRLC